MSRWRDFLRVPSFAVAYSVNALVLLAFALWMFFDLHFEFFLATLKHDLGIEPIFGPRLWNQYGWDEFGPHLALLVVLDVLAIGSAVVVVYRLLYGRAAGRSLRSVGLVVALIAIWLGLFQYWRFSLQEAGFEWNLRRALPEIKADAAILLAEWPQSDGALPFFGRYMSSPQDFPRRLFRGDEPLSWLAGIYKLDDGGLRFHLFFSIKMLEYHPGTNRPTSYRHRDFTYAIEGCTELEPNWFLVSYRISRTP
ncbi:MAG: hypothetical protein WD063_02010 [Pirellulales bacterium]